MSFETSSGKLTLLAMAARPKANGVHHEQGQRRRHCGGHRGIVGDRGSLRGPTCETGPRSPLVARNTERLENLAKRLRAETNRSVEVLTSDLSIASQRRPVEERLREDPGISILVNNAGVGATAPLVTSDSRQDGGHDRTQRHGADAAAYAVAPAFVAHGVPAPSSISPPSSGSHPRPQRRLRRQ